MTLPTYGGLGRPSKFGKKTKTFNIRLPVETIEKIRKQNIDTGRIVYDIVEGGKNPYAEQTPDYEIGPTLLNKLVALMMNEDVVAPEGYFTETEIKSIKQIAERLTGES